MKKRSIISTILAAALLLTACGGGETSTSKTTETNKNAVFKEEANAFKLEEGEISQIAVAGDTLYVEQYIYNYGNVEARDAVEAAVYTTSDMPAEEAAAVEEVITEDVEVIEEEVYGTSTTIRKITSFSMDGTVKNSITQEMPMNQGTGRFTGDSAGNIYFIMYQYVSPLG